MTWLITGGAGFVGAHVVEALRRTGDEVVVLDDLSTGDATRLDPGVPLIQGSVHDAELLRRTFGRYDVRGVVHLAARKQPGDSVERPLFYYRENLGGLGTLLEQMVAHDIDALVFSSSAAVYGDQSVDVMTEDLRPAPSSPYGETKLAGEWLLADVARTHTLRYLALRYFNAAGCGRPELADSGVFNLIPMVFERLTQGKPPLVFGTDYPTPDGTTIRDYIHVADLASAHVAAVRHLESGADARLVLNVGTGVGTSTRELIDTILDVTGYGGDPAYRPIEVDRRPGDPAVSIASPARITAELGWSASHGVPDMVESAWQGWIRTHPEAVRE
ncbi:MAG TPA: UDP-glucose 4-epimerase GalE [Actinopolymorphaceae bacterium]